MPVWGSTWGQLWGSGEIDSTLAEIRQARFSECAYAIFIEGMSDVYVTSHTGGNLTGSGAGSWIGRYEASAAAFAAGEVIGARTVKLGLTIPDSFKCQPDLDPNTGMFRTSVMSFTLTDLDGSLPTLFAQEGKDSYRLLTRIAPGTAVHTSVNVRDTVDGGGNSFSTVSSEWIAANGCYVDLERLGPTGQRRFLPCMPAEHVTWVGHEHASWEDGTQDSVDETSGPPRVRVSFDPLVFEGRKCAIYRIYKDDAIELDSQLSWPDWGDQHAADNLVWFGQLRDSGKIVGNGTSWKRSAFSQEAWRKRTLGPQLQPDWLTVA